VKKFLTLWPNAVAPSVTWFPVYLAPSTTVVPIPFAVSLTPSPTWPSPIFLAPVSTRSVADFTLESSAPNDVVSGAARTSPATTMVTIFMTASCVYAAAMPTTRAVGPNEKGNVEDRDVRG
jgi:hypothetical protein